MRFGKHIHICHLPLRERLERSAVISRSQRTFWRRNKSQVERLFKKFKSGDNLADEKGRGRPINFVDQALLAAVEKNENLAEDFNVDFRNTERPPL